MASFSKEEYIAYLTSKMKHRCTRYKRASDDNQLIKNDLDIIYDELSELETIMNSSRDTFYL